MAGSRVSISLILSYVIDWVIIICIAGVGGGLYKKHPNHRPFSPVDPNISFPYVETEKISSVVLIIVGLVAPAVITFFIALILTPTSRVSGGTSKIFVLRRKLWEWNTAWMGLALSLATTFFFTQGLKIIMGKPRPDLLARCDFDPATLQQYALGGYGSQFPQYNLLISWTACRQTDESKLDDGFQSFPSGHASFSWAGLFYLALYLCSKFAVRIPLLPFTSLTSGTSSTTVSPVPGQHDLERRTESLRGRTAAPPAYLFVLPMIPISAAAYIAGTRFSDFRHHGFDILFGSLLGIVMATISFRLYQLPISRGAGWAWGPRSTSKAWWAGMGVANYADDQSESKKQDVELGFLSNGQQKDSFGDTLGSTSQHTATEHPHP